MTIHDLNFDAAPAVHDPPNVIEPSPRDQWGIVGGGAFILDEPDHIPAIWGQGNEVLWAEGESLMIAGPQGVGKTTLVGQLVRALLGRGDAEVLSQPVQVAADRVLYLAMDRPRQIARSLGRQFTENDRAALDDKLFIRPGPPPTDLAARPDMLAAMAHDLDADIVIVDSVKDAALGLSNDEVGAAYNRARQHLLASGRQLIDLHHTKKRDHKQKDAHLSIDDVYGSTWLTSGCGSVILLNGNPGDPIIRFTHLKQPADEVGPWRLLHDPAAGVLTVEHAVDPIELVRASGADGLTARGLAQAITDKSNPSRADIEKARRKLDSNARLVRVEGGRGGGDNRTPAAWFLAEKQSREPE
ncbi:AAA family ATPase [Mycobacterium barrassiae]|uniref:AAA family ATPase n=1 Tax=Mycobacterium barrassiae TaxID=319709 RepID=UPI00226589B4|nr:AAA family ATPase [Mycobacterium barrassiae]MCV7300879.1 AAA family ATPase [Mycobacterium barrassiae]